MKILLGVCGGIAVYKAVELTREFRRHGVAVQVVLTAGAEQFVTPLTFAAASGMQVLTSLWHPQNNEVANGEPERFDIEHIRVAQEADMVVIAPATANFLATLAHGLAPDLLSTICLATKAPIFVAPAMNVNMWWHPATQANIALLQERGVEMIPPGSGDLACGAVGEGRLAEPFAIADHVLQHAARGEDLAGETVLVTAGGTREAIDAVRFIGNRSSGKMGLALAKAAKARGAKVLLVSAATTVLPPSGCEHVVGQTAAEMESEVLERLPRASMVIMAAAVSDYQVLDPVKQKMKKRSAWTLELTQTPDILRKIIAHRRADTLVCGFAAETDNVVDEGRRKLRDKGVDMIVANDVSRLGAGFDSDQNAGTILCAAGEFELPLSSKEKMAHSILDAMKALRQRRAVNA